MTPQEIREAVQKLPQDLRNYVLSLENNIRALRKHLFPVVPLLDQSHRLVPKEEDEDDDDDTT